MKKYDYKPIHNKFSYKHYILIPKELKELIWEFEGDTFYKTNYDKVLIELMMYSTVDFVICTFGNKDLDLTLNYSATFLKRIKEIKKNKDLIEINKDMFKSDIKELQNIKEFFNCGFLPFMNY